MVSSNNTPYKNIHFVINPNSGKDESILNTINRVLQKYNINWTVSVTQKDKPFQLNMPENTNLIAIYGGDGTVKEVVSNYIDGQLPLAILPGGTGNALAHKLGIPVQLQQALEVITGNHQKIKVDIGVIQIGDTTDYFLLRATIGLYNEMMNATTPEMKDRFGDFAYLMGGITTIKDRTNLDFDITIDGKSMQAHGHTCMIANISTIGGHMPIDLTSQINPDDGLLDVLVLDAISEDVMATIRSQMSIDVSEFTQHWQGREIVIQTKEPQAIFVDGEAGFKTNAEFKVLPQAVTFLAPKSDD